MARRVLAVRHPRPAVPDGTCYGRLDVGLADHFDPAPWLAAAGPVEQVVSSPLRRARYAAEAFAAAASLPLHLDPRWAEIDFGAWEGLAWDAVPRDALDAWAVDPVGYCPGGGEAVRDVLARVQAAWDALPVGGTFLVTHAGPIRCLLHLVGGMPLPEAMQAAIPHGAVLRFGDFTNG